MNGNTIAVIAATFVAIILQSNYGHALDCYICNSHLHKGCNDPIDVKAIALVNCTQRVPNTTKEEDISCRKIVQKVDNEYRYIRECGHIRLEQEEGRDCINRAGTYQVSMKYCKCNSDGCNAATHIVVPSAVALIFGLVLNFYK